MFSKFYIFISRAFWQFSKVFKEKADKYVCFIFIICSFYLVIQFLHYGWSLRIIRVQLVGNPRMISISTVEKTGRKEVLKKMMFLTAIKML